MLSSGSLMSMTVFPAGRDCAWLLAVPGLDAVKRCRTASRSLTDATDRTAEDIANSAHGFALLLRGIDLTLDQPVTLRSYGSPNRNSVWHGSRADPCQWLF